MRLSKYDKKNGLYAKYWRMRGETVAKILLISQVVAGGWKSLRTD
jgi:hypothetical protein